MEMPVIPVNRVVDMKRIRRKNGGPRRRREAQEPSSYVCRSEANV
jgi:hypothetical protein